MDVDKNHCSISARDTAIISRIFNPELPFDDIKEDVDTKPVQRISNEESEEVKQARQLEVEGVKAAENGDLLSALDFFNKAITVAPQRASGYNNRAQALRLKGDIKGAVEDLNKAIEIGEHDGQPHCQAHIQRGLIRRLEGQDEEAFADFKIAANLGNDFAKQLVIKLNPYAAMCNQMLAEVITNIRNGEQ